MIPHTVTPDAGHGVVRLLLIEDDLPLSDGLSRSLRRAGYRVDTALTAGEACDMLGGQPYALIVLDLGLPDLDGSEVVHHLARLGHDTPVLVLSARDGLDERVRLLDLGADDYLIKPAATDEFLARVRAVLRRRRAAGETRLRLGRLSIDIEGQRAYCDEQALDLHSREWLLLIYLARNANRVITKDEIAAALCSDSEIITSNAVEQIMSRFRKRIAPDALRLRTIRGLGYYLEADDDAAGT